MPILVAVTIVVAAAACVAGVLSYLSSRNHRPGWYFIAIATFSVSLSTTVILFRDDLFRLSSWQNDKINLLSVVTAWFLAISFIAFWPFYSLLAVVARCAHFSLQI